MFGCNDKLLIVSGVTISNHHCRVKSASDHVTNFSEGFAGAAPTPTSIFAEGRSAIGRSRRSDVSDGQIDFKFWISRELHHIAGKSKEREEREEKTNHCGGNANALVKLSVKFREDTY